MEPRISKPSAPTFANDPTTTADDKAHIIGAIANFIVEVTPVIALTLGATCGVVGARMDNAGMLDLGKQIAAGGLGGMASRGAQLIRREGRA